MARLRGSTLADGAVYATVRLLPDNVRDIECAIFSAIRDRASYIGASGKAVYALHLLDEISDLGLNPDGIKIQRTRRKVPCAAGAFPGEGHIHGYEEAVEGEVVNIPPERISLKNRILHSPPQR